jgi:hypothetical protein
MGRGCTIRERYHIDGRVVFIALALLIMSLACLPTVDVQEIQLATYLRRELIVSVTECSDTSCPFLEKFRCLGR